MNSDPPDKPQPPKGPETPEQKPPHSEPRKPTNAELLDLLGTKNKPRPYENSAERRARLRAIERTRDSDARPREPRETHNRLPRPARPAEPAKSGRLKKWGLSLGGLFLAALISDGMTGWADARLSTEFSPDVKPDIRVVDTEDYPDSRIVLLESRVAIHNKGLRSGALGQCNVSALGTGKLPKVDVVDVDRASIPGLSTATRAIQFRHEVLPYRLEPNPPRLSYKLVCYDSKGNWLFNIKTAAVPRKAGNRGPFPDDLLGVSPDADPNKPAQPATK